MQKNNRKKLHFTDFKQVSIQANQQRFLKGGSEIITEDDVNN